MEISLGELPIWGVGTMSVAGNLVGSRVIVAVGGIGYVDVTQGVTVTARVRRVEGFIEGEAFVGATNVMWKNDRSPEGDLGNRTMVHAMTHNASRLMRYFFMRTLPIQH